MSVADSPESTARGSPLDGPGEALRDAARKTAREIGVTSVDQDNPWIGLSSFTEETQAYFFGREGEVAELTRRVQRKLLTVLFGKSGLGKTSILRAGLVPGLRAEGYFPVYLRIDYGHDSPEPAEQIKQAINRAARGIGSLHDDGADESIWEFLHHRDDVLQDSSGETLIPLLIFDQFEELFTLAQSDEFGRARAARFVEELADLVENRPPKALEGKLDADESIAERFDFARSDYRVVIALREDYLAPLESLKRQMPTLSQNRLRLAPMTGSQALAAVLQPGNRLRPGKPLVSEEVAEAIVRFVAGGAELTNAEVEPSLLSLICRELNEQRIAQGKAEISQDLLAGSHETILSTFYERALADQPELVRRIIEDDLLTESGYRENLAEESLLRRFQAAGAAPDALAKLVNRRLLRIEERLDVRRVELTHDVLTGVVKASRDQRHEREAREATERMLAEQRERESVARRALRRARAVAAGCTVLAAVAIAAAIFAFVSVKRARHAELVARQTRAVSEQARQGAEGLLGFLTDDFVRELETFGRYQTIAELSQREIDYFQHLPPQLKDPETVRSGALALLNHAQAARRVGDAITAGKNLAEAIPLFEALHRTDKSQATTIALARAYVGQGEQIFGVTGSASEASVAYHRAVNLLRPLAARPGASVDLLRAYLNALRWAGSRDTEPADAMQLDREALRVGKQLDVSRDGDLTTGVDYATAEADLAMSLDNLGRDEEARRTAEDSLAVLNSVLAQRPQYGMALLGKINAEDVLASVTFDELDLPGAARFATEDEQTVLAMVKVEPNNDFYLSRLPHSYRLIADSMWAVGHLHGAIGSYRKAMDTAGKTIAGLPFMATNMLSEMLFTVNSQAQLGDFAGATATLAAFKAFFASSALRRLGPSSPSSKADISAVRAYIAAGVASERGDFAAARRIANTALALHTLSRTFYAIEARAEYALGDFAAAVRDERAALPAAKTGAYSDVSDQRRVAQRAIWLSMALAREGNRAEAAQTIDPVVTMYRTLEKKNHGDQWLPLEFAEALYAQSLSDEPHRAALLREAARRVDHLIPAIATLHDTRTWRARIEAAERISAGEAN